MINQFWLFKSEPNEYSIDDLANESIGRWDGIRNYQARNLLRDQVQVGDRVLFYHSSCQRVGIVGTAVITKAAYPDPAQFDPENAYFDPKATADAPKWFCVDIQFHEKFPTLIPLKRLKQTPELENMVLLKQGRLSIQTVTLAEWKHINCMAAG